MMAGSGGTRLAAGARLGIAAGVAAVAYAALASTTAGGGAGAGWLIGAQAVGWLALAAAWGVRNDFLDTRSGLWIVAAGAVVFRLCGLAATPGWEDDYFRHLWDGWMTWRTGSPYGVAPLEWFGAKGVPARMEVVLDGVNHPEHATIYGPAAQAWAALACGLGAGKLWVFKAGLVAAEAGGLWAIWRLGGGRALLFAAWCPLAVTEIAFAGHVDALAVAAVAGALLCAGRGRAVAACAWVALACATKAYVVLLAPFFLWRGGWRGVAVFVGVLAVGYAPWVAATVSAGRGVVTVLGGGGVGAMAGSFEFNSTGYAVFAWALGDGAARWAAAGLLAGGLAVIWARWVVAVDHTEAAGSGEFVTNLVTNPDAFRGKPGGGNVTRLVTFCKKMGWGRGAGEGGGVGEGWVPGAAVVGWWALWSPVFHPWYALLALPFLALRPSGWGAAMLAVLPLSYAHGLTLTAGSAGATGDFRHPWWVRPAEMAGVALGALSGWLCARRRRSGGGARDRD